jgi:hypothetical protein
MVVAMAGKTGDESLLMSLMQIILFDPLFAALSAGDRAAGSSFSGKFND